MSSLGTVAASNRGRNLKKARGKELGKVLRSFKRKYFTGRKKMGGKDGSGVIVKCHSRFVGFCGVR